jgi:hypothetical protein
MQRNEGTLDRTLRIAVGLGLLALAFIGPKTPWAGALALVLLVTGLVGFCPVYRVFGIRTCRAHA